ncbi:tetratricopeptide repeat protein [Streptomyces sp. NPDC056390]|uniref:tetratricopeptide repeat protein n=1 Tax=Streptomyces sp. NPDC056390 TaxID=3345806 RepID=UPI0035D8BA6E
MSAQVVVGDGSVGAGGDVSHNAIGRHSQVFDNRQTHIHNALREVPWPLEVGNVPNLATAFQPRAGLRAEIDAARAQGSTTVLTQVLSGGGGVGKTQLAAAYAAEAARGETDLVLWVPAVEVQQVITLFAQAAVLVSAPGATGESFEDDARALLSWLATTQRRWLIVFDDITDPVGLTDWWPASRTGSGWVLATTRLHDASLTGNNRRRISVNVYTPGEATAYLRTRLCEVDAAHLLEGAADDLAAALGYLPLALGHAAAYMINQDLTCAEYLARFTDNSQRLGQLLPTTADTEGYGRQIATTLLLSLDAAQRTEPTGLAQPALQLAALLDPAGHPHALWNTPSVLTYLAEQRTQLTGSTDRTGASQPVTSEQAEAVLRVLHRYALISSDRRREPRAVRIHALTARATREATPGEALSVLADSVADALLHAWPEPDQPHTALATTLRTNTDYLHRHTADHLWYTSTRHILFRAGRSLHDAGLYADAVMHWGQLVIDGQRILGPEHASTLAARTGLASAYSHSGRVTEAIALEEQVLVDQEQFLGPEHPDTLTTRNNLANSYLRAGRIQEATLLEEGVLADRERILGAHHPDTLIARYSYSGSVRVAGRTSEAITLAQGVLVDQERLLGHFHPHTLATLNALADAYSDAGGFGQAAMMREDVLHGRVRVLGPHHPDTLATRARVVASNDRGAGKAGTVNALKDILADQERILGSEHPHPLTTRSMLADACWRAGCTDEAVTLRQDVLVSRKRILGPDHPDTLATRASLAHAYQEVGRAAEAIALAEGVLAVRLRIHGIKHPDTLDAAVSLANFYAKAERVDDATSLLEHALHFQERAANPSDFAIRSTRFLLAQYRKERLGRPNTSPARTSHVAALRPAERVDRAKSQGPD